MVIAEDWQSITVVVVGDYRRENGGMQRYRPTGIVCLNCFGGDELDVLCEVRSFAEDEGMEKVYGTSGAQELGRTLSEGPLAPNTMGDVTICTGSLAVCQKRVTIEFGWTSAPKASRFWRRTLERGSNVRAYQGRTVHQDKPLQ